ncbi:thiamine diphosphokinase [Crassaminicella profunda]|uniref:thiamine diphosphokinase n=1 Tax=Crassaminicella profunda TaxID=1286698 RepID=UPI001CA67BE7|nr:thiamine diphosphokinase [Crassaminicella profunda]QZY57116.1 thiamine diphosphokinase [Crassaminicella profunda]
MKCVIIANGDINHYEGAIPLIEECNCIICADGGARHLFKMNILPHMIVGDLDSIDEDTKEYFEKENIALYKFPKKKDYTDMELAIEYALKKGATEIVFLGAIGSRMDHTIANITLLRPLAEKGIKAKIMNEHNEIMVIENSLEIEGEIGDTLSIIPLSEEVVGVTLKGLEYPLEDATIPMGSSIGISNRFMSTKAKINIKKGKLLVIKARD